VGVNKFQPKDEQEVDVLLIDNQKVRADQLKQIKETKRTRDADALNSALKSLKVAAETEGNLLEAAIVAARARATLGEISDTLESIKANRYI
jgi:methylmalonyl-CoA mutase